MPFKFYQIFQNLPTCMSNLRYFMSKSLIHNRKHLLLVTNTTPKRTTTRGQIAKTPVASKLQKDSFKLAKENSPKITKKFSEI